ncbi:MAG: hypothetical protein ACM3OA_03720 [Acidobacteriota bacterium]|jgi:hypothetical protein
MTARSAIWAGAAIAAVGLAACKTTQAPAPASAGEVSAAPAPATGGIGGTSGGGTSIPTLVSVNLQNVANNLSVSLKVNRDNIPVTAQVPVDVAASVCGVSVSALAASAANGHATCTATTTTPQLTQAVQQQIASGGSVTGGPQTMGGSTTNNMM